MLSEKVKINVSWYGWECWSVNQTGMKQRYIKKKEIMNGTNARVQDAWGEKKIQNENLVRENENLVRKNENNTKINETETLG